MLHSLIWWDYKPIVFSLDRLFPMWMLPTYLPKAREVHGQNKTWRWMSMSIGQSLPWWKKKWTWRAGVQWMFPFFFWPEIWSTVRMTDHHFPRYLIMPKPWVNKVFPLSWGKKTREIQRAILCEKSESHCGQSILKQLWLLQI